MIIHQQKQESFRECITLDVVCDAAEQGDAMAQYNLGMMYLTGRGIPFNYVQAYAWLSLAASQQHRNARKDLKFVAARMTLEQIAQAKELVRNWKPAKTEPPSSFTHYLAAASVSTGAAG
ncbi:MAG: SEL1-like repeat protein [Magnetococcales bacterium]|nr:SEL1-like repeat protein [Magnetococcales bacterium]